MKTKIELQEQKDRYIAEKCLESIFNNNKQVESWSVNGTDIKCPVDLKGNIILKNGKEIKFSIEIKERYKNQQQLQKYPNVELRKDKYKRMLSESPYSLLYMVFLNQQTCYLFNMKKLDWSKVSEFDFWVKETQVDPNSPIKRYPSYSIPKELAVVKMDCSKYFEDYANYQQTQKEIFS